MPQRQFQIPLQIEPGQADRIRQVWLFHSADRGQSWEAIALARPDDRTLNVTVDQDGEHWFAAQVLQKDGTLIPADHRTLAPQLKVRVETGVLRLEAPDRSAEIAAIRAELKRLENRLKELEGRKGP